MRFGLVNTLNYIAREHFQGLNWFLGTRNNRTLQRPNVLLPQFHRIQIFMFCERHLPLLFYFFSQTKQSSWWKAIVS